LYENLRSSDVLQSSQSQTRKKTVNTYLYASLTQKCRKECSHNFFCFCGCVYYITADDGELVLASEHLEVG
jgi:hypothetical protein